MTMPLDQLQSMTPQQREAYILALRAQGVQQQPQGVQMPAAQTQAAAQMQDVGGGYSQEAAAIQQQRALAEALRKQAGTPIETNRMAGRFVVPVSPLEGLAKMGQSYFAGRAEREAAKREGELATKSSEALARALKGDEIDVSDPYLDPDMRKQLVVSEFQDRRQAKRDAVQIARDEFKARQQLEREQYRYDQMDKRQQAQFEQAQEMQRRQFEQQASMLSRQIAAADARAASGGNASPYYTAVPTDKGLMRFNARTGQIEPLTDAEQNVLVNTKDDPNIRGAVAGAQARGKELGAASGVAEAGLPAARDAAIYAKETIDKTLAAPGLSTATGFSGQIDPRNYIAGTEATDAQVKIKQLEGQAFKDAFETLKGGGHITEVEGQKATAANARLDRAQSDAEFRAALNELKEVIDIGYRRAMEKAGKSPGAPAQSPTQPIVVDW